MTKPRDRTKANQQVALCRARQREGISDQTFLSPQ
jgi:hypothetical protein